MARIGIDQEQSSQKDFQAPTGNNHLLIIGVNEYAPGINNLLSAVADAEAVRDCLLKNYYFESEYCTTLLNSEATRASVLDEFDRLIDELTDQDSLVFYFAGHGQLVKSINKGFWLLSDAVAKRRASYLSNDEVVNFITHLKARHVFGIVDSCFSGTLFRKVDGEVPSRVYNFPSRYLLTAGRQEPVLDGSKHSPFAQSLLTQLRYESAEYQWVGDICRKVLRNTKFNSDQTPRGEPLQGVGHQGGEFALIRKGAALPAPPTSKKDDFKEFGFGSTRSVPAVASEAPNVNMPDPQRDLGAWKAYLRRLVAGTKLKVFFEIVNSWIKDGDDLQNQVILLEARFNQLSRDKSMGLLNDGSARVEMARINNSLNYLINEIELMNLRTK
jgi:hypothetical protein